MHDFFNPLFIAPLGSIIFAITGFIVILQAMRTQSWKVKRWLIIFMFSWIPWSGFTMATRFASSSEFALLFLRLSFIFLQLAFLSLYRFHHILVFRTTDRRFTGFLVEFFVSLNIVMSLNPQMLGVIKVGEYYTDSFHAFLQLTNLALALIAGVQTYRALRELDIFSGFFNSEGKRSTGQMFLGFIILLITIGVLFVWMFQDLPEGATPDATLFIFLSWAVILYLTITYGIRPLSTILSPQRIWSILLINSKSGLPIFSKSFEGVQHGPDYILFAGAINAANTMFQLQLNSPSSLNLVTLEDRAVMIHTQDDLHFCIVVDHYSAHFELLLKAIVDKIRAHKKYKEIDIFDPHLKTEFMDPVLTDLLEVK